MYLSPSTIATKTVRSKPTGVKQLTTNKIKSLPWRRFFLPYDFRTEVFSLGATRFSLLTKTRPALRYNSSFGARRFRGSHLIPGFSLRSGLEVPAVFFATLIRLQSFSYSVIFNLQD